MVEIINFVLCIFYHNKKKMKEQHKPELGKMIELKTEFKIKENNFRNED